VGCVDVEKRADSVWDRAFSEQILESLLLVIAVGLELRRQGMVGRQLPNQPQEGFFQAGQPPYALGA
jgi:hypothetical protein